ncbi:MAG: AraC family transcriptional regulator [Clostridiales bacterium]|nr:AraC family transcriptional regulator [Clostridiales bacterium]
MKSHRSLLRKTSVLTQLFISYIILLLFVMLVSSVLQNQTTNILVEENERANNAILMQFRSFIDEKLAEMPNYALQSYTAVSNLNNANTVGNRISSFSRYRANSVLQDIFRTSQSIERILFYYNEEDYVISESGSVSSQNFFHAYYQTDSFDLENWNSLLKSPTSNGFISFPASSGAWSIAYSYIDYSENKKAAPDKVFVVLRIPILQRALLDSKQGNHSAYLVYNSDGMLLTSTDSLYNNFDLSSYFSGENTFEMEHEGSEYVTKVVRSDRTGCYYASITPKKLAAEAVTASRRQLVVFVLIITPLGVALAYAFSKRNSVPLKRLVQWLDEKAIYLSQGSQSTNEIYVLENALKLSVEEQEKLMLQIHNRKNDLTGSFVKNLLYGLIYQDSSINMVFEQYNINLLSEQFAVILMKIEKKDVDMNLSDSQELIVLVIANIMEELSGKRHQGFVVPISENDYACLVNLSDSDNHDLDIINIAQEGKEAIESNFKIYFTISISRVNEGIDGIAQAFQQALLAMQYRLTMGPNQIIPYNEMMQEETSYAFSFKTDQKIIAFLSELRNRESIHNFVNELFNEGDIGHHTKPEVAKIFMYDLSGSVIKALNEKPYGDIHWKKASYERLINCDVLDTFRNELTDVLIEYRKYMQDESSLNTIGAKVLKYISQHFQNPDLSVSALGDEFKLSSSYLSKIFREEYELSIVDYISNSRINHSKKLLRQTDLSVQQIAEHSGFLSSSVFIRVFKKAEGTTPGLYRKMHDTTHH